MKSAAIATGKFRDMFYIDFGSTVSLSWKRKPLVALTTYAKLKGYLISEYCLVLGGQADRSKGGDQKLQEQVERLRLDELLTGNN